jgi:hypothetical protein
LLDASSMDSDKPSKRNQPRKKKNKREEETDPRRMNIKKPTKHNKINKKKSKMIRGSEATSQENPDRPHQTKGGFVKGDKEPQEKLQPEKRAIRKSMPHCGGRTVNQKKQPTKQKKKQKQRNDLAKKKKTNKQESEAVELLKAQMAKQHLSHLPIQDQLRELVLGWFVCRTGPSKIKNWGPAERRAWPEIQPNLPRAERRANRETGKYWRLTMLGRYAQQKCSGSHAGAKKAYQQDFSYNDYGLCPLILTHHAQQRLQERGSIFPRFVPNTRQTVVATFLPLSNHRFRMQKHQKRKLLRHEKRKRRSQKHVEKAGLEHLKRVKFQKNLDSIRTRRSRIRKDAAEKKRRVDVFQYQLTVPTMNQDGTAQDIMPVRRLDTSMMNSKKTTKQDQSDKKKDQPEPRAPLVKKVSEAQRKRIHKLMDAANIMNSTAGTTCRR